MTERKLPQRLTVAAITLGIGAGLTSDGRNTSIPAPELAATGISTPLNDHIQPFSVERIVIENVTIPGSLPTELSPQIQDTVAKAWRVFSNGTNGRISEEVPEIVLGGNHTFGEEAGKVQDACVDDRARDMLRNVVDLARRDSPVEHTPNDLTIAIINPESRDCDTVTGSVGSRRVPAAFGSGDQQSIVLFDGEEGPNTAVVAHEIDHAVTGYGHDNRLDCEPAQNNVITVTADCQRVGAGNLDTLMGFNIVESDADPRTGFELRRLGAIGEDAVQTIESNTSADVTLQAIAS